MKGKHAALSEQKQIKTLKAIIERLETNLAAERKERKTLQHKLTDQSSTLKEITRLRGQVNDRVSDKYLKLKKKYDKTKGGDVAWDVRQGTQDHANRSLGRMDRKGHWERK